MSKKITVTARGIKLDMDALKRSQPTATKIIAGKKRTASKSIAQKTSITRPYNARVHATVPAPLPKPEAQPEAQPKIESIIKKVVKTDVEKTSKTESITKVELLPKEQNV